MGMDDFAPYQPINGCFTVLNTSPQVKTISIFQYPINYHCTRNLLLIPGVGEDDIRASLLKGELRYKILANDIVVLCSDIDLLQFNRSRMAFLQSAGIINGLQVGSVNINVSWNQDVVLSGNVDGVNTVFTTPSRPFIEKPPSYKIVVYKNGVKQLFLNDYIITESGGPGTGYDTVILAIPPNTVDGIVDVITADYFTDNTVNPQ
jgi:hypothetical protein